MRKTNIEHSTSNIEHRTSNIEHRTSNIEHRTSNIEPAIGDIPYWLRLQSRLRRDVDAVLDAGGSQRERKTVLVVEDSDDDLVLFQRAAQEAKCGLSFQYVEDGEKALAYLEGEGAYTDREAHPFPDLVILDLRLLQLDGFEVLEYIRNRPGCKNLEVIVLSGRDDPPSIAQAMAAGADRFISKPIKATTLQGVAELLGSAVVVL